MKYVEWEYFMALESDLETISRYIEICEENFDVYSIELTRLYLSTCSEIDVIAKMLCKLCEPTESPGNINEYREILLRHTKLHETKMRIKKFGFETTPWEEWLNANNPSWWTMYNHVKHERNKYYSQANLKNVISALCGLQAILLFYYEKRDGKPIEVEGPNLIGPNHPVIGERIVWAYSLPK